MTTYSPIVKPLQGQNAPYFWAMYQLINHHKYRDTNVSNWFSKENKRFFGSRIQTIPPYRGRVFVSSEKMFSYRGKEYPRRYSIRVIRHDGSIDTIGEFQQYTTREEAHRAAKEFAHKTFPKYK